MSVVLAAVARCSPSARIRSSSQRSYLAAVTPELVRVDLAAHRLPNRLVLPGAGRSASPALGLEWMLDGAPPLVPRSQRSRSRGSCCCSGSFDGMGMGDVKLAAALGLASPTVAIAVLTPVIAFLVGGIAARRSC